MLVETVRTGSREERSTSSRTYETAYGKQLRTGDVTVTVDGLDGDLSVGINHGGPDQAVYVYGGVDYEWWATELGAPLPDGAFGENLRIAGLASADHRIGDRLLIGDVVLEVSFPRVPCHKLAHHLGDHSMVRRFRAAQRPGFYCRVLTPGLVRVGLPVAVASGDGSHPSVREAFNAFLAPAADPDLLDRVLAAPIAVKLGRFLIEKRAGSQDIARINAQIDEIVGSEI